jgi:type IV fimbrial biogenesis protein FimT
MHKPHGVTLPELLIVMAIVGLLATLAVPSFKRLIQANAISSGVSLFMADLRFARSEAIKRGGVVVMCRSDAPEKASPTCGTGSKLGWQSGWIIFHDLNNNSNKTATETLLRVQAPLAAIDSIAEAGPATKFEFFPTGRPKGGAYGRIQFGGNKTPNDLQRLICIDIAGRARIAGDGNSSCYSGQ